jgi:hypothetical protein
MATNGDRFQEGEYCGAFKTWAKLGLKETYAKRKKKNIFYAIRATC